jgi:zinc transport system ATP-binding protein
MAGDPLLEIFGLAVTRERETLLAGVDLTVERGSVHLLVGPNGAGKSTLLRAVLGQIPFSGRIELHWRGTERIGFVPQSFAVDRTLPVTVADFLALARQRRPVCLGTARATRERIATMLDTVGLAGFGPRRLAVLSGGELRRVLLAHAIEPVPELLVLDEPASGLDEAASARFDEVVLGLRRDHGVSALVVSHDRAQVRRLADRVTLLDRRVLASGEPDAVLANSWATFGRATDAARPAAGAR